MLGNAACYIVDVSGTEVVVAALPRQSGDMQAHHICLGVVLLGLGMKMLGL